MKVILINPDFMHDVDTTVQPLTMYTIAGIISPFVDQVEVIEPMKYRIANLQEDINCNTQKNKRC